MLPSPPTTIARSISVPIAANGRLGVVESLMRVAVSCSSRIFKLRARRNSPNPRMISPRSLPPYLPNRPMVFMGVFIGGFFTVGIGYFLDHKLTCGVAGANHDVVDIIFYQSFLI